MRRPGCGASMPRIAPITGMRYGPCSRWRCGVTRPVCNDAIGMDATQPNPYANLSVVVPAFNEEKGIREALRSLLAAVPGAEIIVIDDASTDGTAEAVLEFPEVVLAQHPFNRGYGA